MSFNYARMLTSVPAHVLSPIVLAWMVTFFTGMRLLGLAAALVALLYHFRWLLAAQQPLNNTPMWGFVTIKAGDRWNLCLANGQLRTVSGPQLIRVWGDTLLQLVQCSAIHSQYLLVQYVDGRSEIIPGPAQVYMDRSIHKDVKIKDAVNLTDTEVLVVYRDENVLASGLEKQTSEEIGTKRLDQGVTRHVIRGPCLHMPKNATEWTHQFNWHGSVSNDPDANGRKVKGAVKFTKLRVCPEQTYFDVEGVRTKDDALVSVKVMIFYRLQEIDVMLKETHDPTADFINSVSSDVVKFVARKSFEEFKSATDQLNELSVYEQLTSRAKGIGFEITKVVFRGYGAPQRLQKMHDDAIERRTKLALERENEDQEQHLLDMKLEHEEERLRKRRQMETDTKEHERKLQRAAHEAKQQELVEIRQAQLQHLNNMKSTLGMTGEQLSAYLLASEQGPPSKLVQIVGKECGASGGSSFIIQDTA
jgi:hypothetical protein